MDTAPRSQRLLAVARLVETQLSHAWRLDELAERACYSRHHFEKVFAELTGLTPMDYLRQRRLQQAALRVRHEHTSMLQLAHESGFASDSVFSRNFRQAFGYAPRDWREGAWRAHHDEVVCPQWQSLHARDPAGQQREAALAAAARKPDVLRQALVRYCRAHPVWLARGFGIWGSRAEAFREQCAAELDTPRRAPFCCAILREDPAFITGEHWLYDWAVLAQTPAPAGWFDDVLPGGFYLCLRYQGNGAQWGWLYGDWLERQHRWTLDGRRPHLNVYRQTAAGIEGELRLPVRLT
ncbi:helix-turn-helix domain-containing protein [Chitinilyticum piscinae]|uniref:Helix-turn-helix domain-containing protein n=1 Tax=Chitinilyticum piscinae TaxID=2866724 RepID=A0A8J7FLG7_9NEIS|nr:helix-turn-helix domain-containing protein [Chitinilyticum piscinae]MBE9609990.1 helix-turn-helix domain-containing protein [Chitinilyticum piscinae]